MIELQQKLLGDRRRNDAFYRALTKAITPGVSTVTDIGSGTGFLSFLARQLGARHCNLYEADEAILELSKNLARENKIEGLTFIQGYSDEIKNPQKTNIVVSETLGNFAYDEHIIEIMNDAHRFLISGGTMIPYRIEQFVAPVIAPRIYKELTVWDNIGYKLSWNIARKSALNNMYVYAISPRDVLAEPKSVDDCMLATKPSSTRRGRAEWKMKETTTVYGFALWWTAHLSKDVMFSTSPLNSSDGSGQKKSHWEQIYLPLERPLILAEKEKLLLEFESDTRYSTGVQVKWTTQSAREKQVMDTSKGMK